jgi:hypothetical protein
MALYMVHAIERNKTYELIRAGKYPNLYGWSQLDFNGGNAPGSWIMPAAEDNDCFAPTANMNPAGALSWCQVQALALSGSQNTNQQGSDTDADFFSATCLYAGISLTDQFRAAGETPPPIGLMNNAQGGTTVEQWIPMDVQKASGCKNVTCLCPWPTPGWTNCPIYGGLDNPNCTNGLLYHSKVEPIVNTTIRAVMWYQGESARAKRDDRPHAKRASAQARATLLWRMRKLVWLRGALTS